MNIAILGTGMVGATLASNLVQLGHQITMGSRNANSQAGQEWLRSVGGKGRVGTFAEAAAAGEIVIDCTNGANAIEALRQAGTANLRGKILIQVGNPLDFSKGMPPTLTICNTDSLGEQTQREFPEVRVVKALNTVNCGVMVDPSSLQGPHELFICGNDAQAKADVTRLLGEWFGWKRESIIDVGDITNARGTEMFLALWVRLWGRLGTPLFNIHIAPAAGTN
jgi:predicted dinucleotide-binding enzyme